ncbi:TPA: type II toxin-antitoxin system RelB/DinJ family antitoxin [Streptococcus suis]|nr:type II toxin-antitoxin system RelB/DinJ family antitoxin [Streptococcus suis]HEL2095963.1 type II toxin-antitoxin system RelB/DinJ family antitoxin [Streptococcus suis]
MATKTRLNINVDSELKEKAGEILAEIGLDYTSAVTVFLKQLVLERKIPFELKAKKWYTVEEVAGENWRDGLDEIEDEWE